MSGLLVYLVCESAEVRSQVVGGRWQVKVRYIFLPGTFYENIKSAWESAKVNDTFCQTLFTKILKVLLNFDNKCPR